jgi:hypothetical protein
VPRLRDSIASTVTTSILLVGCHLSGQDARRENWNLDFNKADLFLCMKGRVQDHEYCPSRFPDRVIAEGTSAIPFLISHITDVRATKPCQFHFWSYTTNGDIAYIVLIDLFTDSDWTTITLPGLPVLNCKEGETGESCWRAYLKAHGREYVRKKCLEAWETNKARVYWDQSSRCFRLHAVALEGQK